MTILFKKYLFLAMLSLLLGRSLVVECRGHSLAVVLQASHCGGSCCGAQAPGHLGSVALG